MRILLLVVFGALGTLARYALQGSVQIRGSSTFPSGTLAVNLTGCFLLGLIGQFTLKHLVVSSDWRIAITIGFFGAFTTFSTVSWETVKMLEDGEWLRASTYVAISIFAGIALAFFGMRLADRI